MDRIGGWWEKLRHRCLQGIGQSRWGNGLPLTKTIKNGKGQLSGGRLRILAAGYSVTDAQGAGPWEATFPTLGLNGNPLQYYCLENPMDRGAR